MQPVSTVQELSRRGHRRVALACGVFDGVHRGHQAILDELCTLARRRRATPVALTFNPHPRAVLDNGPPPRVLTTHWQKVRLLRQYGAEDVVMIHFSHQVAAMSATSFVHNRLLAGDVDIAGLCVGDSWRFGCDGEGDTELLRQLGRTHGFEVSAVPEVTWYRKPISSTRIREAIQKGRLDRARRMLGHPYRVCGHVIHGKGIGSRCLHCPTANLADPMILLPPGGVYAARSFLYTDEHDPNPRPLRGVVYIGSAPTFGDGTGHTLPPSLELHLLDFHEDIYGARIEVEFVEFLRREHSFAGESELEQQIQHDITQARSLLA